MKNNLFNQWDYGDKELTLKQKAQLVDDYIDIFIRTLSTTFEELDIWTSGSVLYNHVSIGCSAKIKKQCLSKKRIEELKTKCSECGKEYDDFVKYWKERDFD